MAKTKTEQGMNKMEAVRAALSDLGKAAMPLQLQPHIKQKYGIDMSVDHVSTYKSLILRKKSKGKGKKAAAVNGAATHASNGAAAPATKPVPAVKAAKPAGSISEQVAMLKQVAGAIGKEEAKKILDLL